MARQSQMLAITSLANGYNIESVVASEYSWDVKGEVHNEAIVVDLRYNCSPKNWHLMKFVPGIT